MIKSRYDGLNIILTPNDITLKTRSGEIKKSLTLTKDDIRGQLAKIGYVCPYNKFTKDDYYSDALEHYALPYMNFIYYYEFFKLCRVPTFGEFYNCYLTTYCEKRQDGTYKIKEFFVPEDFYFTEKQLIGRVSRSYNSFHREVELLFHMAEYEDIRIQYSLQYDLKGIDFLIYYKDMPFGAASYLGSSASFEWKEVKNTNRHDYSNIEMIDIVANIGRTEQKANCDKINGIFVYSSWYVDKKYQEIKDRYQKIKMVS